MKCEVCHCDYSADWSAERRHHLIAHYEWFNGIRLRQPHAFEIVGEVQGLRVLLVRPSSPIFAKRRAERVSRRSIRESVNEGGYDKPTYFAETSNSTFLLFPHAVLIVRDGCGVGIVVIERRPIVQFYRWKESGGWELARELANTVRWTIVHAWLLPASLRGQYGAGARGQIRVRRMSGDRERALNSGPIFVLPIPNGPNV